MAKNSQNKEKEKGKEKIDKSFEEYYQEVEEIVQALEGGNLSLSELLSKYEQGVHALKKCYDILHQTEKKIEVLKKDFEGKFQKEEFPSPEA